MVIAVINFSRSAIDWGAAVRAIFRKKGGRSRVEKGEGKQVAPEGKKRKEVPILMICSENRFEGGAK